jgi:hypothetical protein
MLPFYYKQSAELIFLFVKHDRELRAMLSTEIGAGAQKRGSGCICG